MRKRWLFWLLVVAGGIGGVLPAAAEEYTIAVIPKGTTHEFWKSIHAGAVQAAGELGVEITKFL